MFSAIYIEEEVRDSVRVQEILRRFPAVPRISCNRYGEVFNRSAQNFRLQKKAPALILAKKYGNLVLPSPEGYGFKEGSSYYFSHMLNCLYDCRYCFLQGMFRSANYVLFVNYEDFALQIEELIEKQDASSIYYSGYDCDSLAMEPVSKFSKFFLPFFEKYPESTLEIRTKSMQIRCLNERAAIPNCIVAMSFTSHESSKKHEHKVASNLKRIQALQKLQGSGWKVALRFEPIIFEDGLLENYRALFFEIFSSLDVSQIHSVSIGEFRMPVSFHKNIARIYPDEELFAREILISDGVASLKDTDADVIQQLETLLFEHIHPEQYYRCA